MIPGKSCCPLKKNISSTTSTPQPWTTQTLMPGLKLMAHARVKMGPSPLQLRGELYFSSTSVSERVIIHSRPMVMLVGQYSTGKTTFIRYLLEQV